MKCVLQVLKIRTSQQSLEMVASLPESERCFVPKQTEQNQEYMPVSISKTDKEWLVLSLLFWHGWS